MPNCALVCRPSFAVLWLACAVILCACSPKGKNKVDNPKATAKPTGVVRVLVVDDVPLAEAVEREWKARAEGEIEVRNLSAAEFVELKKLSADAIIYPAGLLGELVERDLIVPVPDDVQADDNYAWRDLLPLARQHENSWGGKPYALPLGSPQLTLLYLADLFEKLGLKPPNTWAEYQALAEKLADGGAAQGSDTAKGNAWHAVCEPLGPGWASQTLLARAAGYARDPDQYSTLFDMKTMDPLIAGPPFVKALEELLATAKLGPAEATKFTPHDARREFLAGRCAMALCWPTGSRAEAKAASESSAPPSAAFCELPGAHAVYNVPAGKWLPRRAENEHRVPLLAVAGRLGSVAKESRRQRQAFSLLAWLSGPDASGDIATQSRDTTPFRASHLASPGAWAETGLDPQAVGQYAQTIEASQQKSVRLYSVRIPGRARYLAALDNAVHQAVAGDKSPADALSAAAEAWRGITNERGVEKQRQAYQRSLGLDL